MNNRIVGFAGQAQSGKNTAAEVLAAEGWIRLAFADPIRELVEYLDPIIDAATDPPLRASQAVARVGYEQAKASYPEFRATLQQLGAGARNVLGSTIWADAAEDRIKTLTAAGHHIVFTDVRYQTEVDLIRSHGGKVIEVTRIGSGLPGDAGTHETETQELTVDATISNDKMVADLHEKVRTIIEEVAS